MNRNDAPWAAWPPMRICRAALGICSAFLLAAGLAACGGGGGSTGGGPAGQAPTISIQPSDQGTLEGNAATFNVTATGDAPLAYQWGVSSDGLTYFAIGGAQSASYSTGPTTASQDGQRYRVIVSNALGTVISSPVRLTVTPSAVAPTIVVQPMDQTVVAPAAAAFTVTASGTAPVYQWQASTDGGATFADVAGAPSAPTLTLAATTTSQNGTRYRVRLGNSAGTVTSSVALLTVNAATVAPAFTLQPAPVTTVVGGTATFTVAATGTPAPGIQWQVNGAPALAGPAQGACFGASYSGVTSTTLTVTAASLGCSGAMFSAVASNGVAPDATSNAVALTVNPVPMAPAIVVQPSDVSVLEPAAATFGATALGVPSPSVQWQQSTDGGTTWTNINGATSPSYTTAATVAADNGKRFRAIFSNASGSATTSSALLSVTPKQALQLLAGDIGGNGSIDGATITARFGTPVAIAVDSAGAAYVAEQTNATIRKILPGGVVQTLAGQALNPGHVDATGSAARFFSPKGIAVDGAGNVYVTDQTDSTVRKITAAGVVTTFAGASGQNGATDGPGSTARFAAPAGIAIGPTGIIYVGDPGAYTLRAITPAGVVSTLAGSAGNGGELDGTGGAAQFRSIQGLATDAAGNIYVADYNRIRKVTPAGVVTTLAGSGTIGSADGAGVNASFAFPQGVAVDGAGNVFVADTGNYTIRKVTPAGVVATVAGTVGTAGSQDGPVSSPLFDTPSGLAFNAAGTLFVADTQNNTIRQITGTLVQTYAGKAALAGATDATGQNARFNFPIQLAVDASGALLVSDFYGPTIRKVATSGAVTTLAGTALAAGSTDGTGSAARFAAPAGIAVDSGGTIYVSDEYNHVVRRLTAAGAVTTLAGTAPFQGTVDGTGAAARFNYPFGAVTDSAGNVYVADSSNNAIRKITPAGAVSTFAGSMGFGGSTDGTGSIARFFMPAGLAIDGAGNVYVADSGNHTIRKITPAGAVTTLAGSPGNAGSADGTGAAARFHYPIGLAADSAGNVFVADVFNNVIRKVTAAGVVTTVVGQAGEAGVRLGNTPRLSAPYGVAVIGVNRLAITSANAVLIANLP